MRFIAKGTTSHTIYVFIQDSSSTTGAGLTGLAFNTGSLTAYYVRSLGSSTAITLATLAAVTTAWSSGGFKEIDATNHPGVYRLDVPDACFATGANEVTITLRGAANMMPCEIGIQLMPVPANITQINGADATLSSGGGFSRGGSSMGISGSSGHRKMLATDSTQTDFVSGTPLANGYRSDVTNSSGTLIIASLANWPIVLLNGYAGAWITFLGDANNATYDYRLWQVMGSYGSGKKLPGADPFSDLDGIELSCVGYGAVTLGTATTAGAVLGTTYKVADTVTFTAATSATTPPGFMSQLATTYGQPTPAAYSPADNTVAKLFVPNFSQGALGFVLEFDLGTATYANAEYTLTL